MLQAIKNYANVQLVLKNTLKFNQNPCFKDDKSENESTYDLHKGAQLVSGRTKL